MELIYWTKNVRFHCIGFSISIMWHWYIFSGNGWGAVWSFHGQASSGSPVSSRLRWSVTSRKVKEERKETRGRVERERERERHTRRGKKGRRWKDQLPLSVTTNSKYFSSPLHGRWECGRRYPAGGCDLGWYWWSPGGQAVCVCEPRRGDGIKSHYNLW